MRRILIRIACLTLLLSACAPAPSSPEPQPTLSAATGAARTPTDTPAPTMTSPPTEPLAFYRVRIEFETSSDWSTLELLNPEHVLTARRIEILGAPSGMEAGVATWALTQPLEQATARSQVGLIADLALDEGAVGTRLQMRLEKGDIGASLVRVTLVSEAGEEFLKQVEHDRVIAGSQGLNSVEFDVSLQSLSSLQAEVAAPAWQPFGHLLWAFYYPWYTRADWSSPQLSDHPLDPYASSARSTIEQHVRQAKEAGIDGFISSWWGPGSDTDRNLQTLLEVAQVEGFRVSIYFETLAENGPRPTQEIVDWLSYAIRTYGEHPAFARIDGRPVIFLWASGASPLQTWQQILEEVDARGLDAFYLGMGYSLSNLEIFDGLHEYGVFTYDELEETVLATARGVHAYGLLTEEPAPKLWAATVQPGYDDRLIPGREGLVQERLDGAYYRRTWEAALASDPDWVLITTWNEWWETTHIEPSQTFGELYLDLTRDYASRWKGG